jgi:NAD(P)-dependent dehydrogenase (short-subunit alcohol dehydrogenase family)
MSISLSTWLEAMRIRLEERPTEFALYAFEGTRAEIAPQLAAWKRPVAVTVEEIDVADVVADAAGLEEAREIVQARLRQIASNNGQMIVLVSGVNVMAALYPTGFLRPVYSSLRADGRVVVMVMPPRLERALPLSARLDDWRAAIAVDLAEPKSEHTITGGGALTR